MNNRADYREEGLYLKQTKIVMVWKANINRNASKKSAEIKLIFST